MMDQNEVNPILLARANEMLRQERDTFDQQRAQDRTWFVLRVTMGYSSVVLLTAICVISIYILVNNKEFPSSVVISAGSALFIDVLGLLAGIWKVVISPKAMGKLAPITRVELPPPDIS